MADRGDPIERWEPWPESPALVGLSGPESSVLVDPDDPTLAGMPLSRPLRGFSATCGESPGKDTGEGA